MKFKEVLKESFLTLTLNKIRTGLAMLGIIIGIASVIALMSLGEGSKKSIQDQIQSLGSNLLTVSPGALRSGNVRSASGSQSTLKNEDAKAIKNSSQITTIKNVSPELSRQSQITTGTANTNTRVIGVVPEYATVHNISIENGSFITQSHLDSSSAVAVIGPTTSQTLFGTDNPLGQTLRISGKTFTVIGITVSKGGSGFINQDDIVYIPLYVAQKQIYGVDYLSSIALEANSSEVMVQAQDEVGYLLMSQHKIADINKIDFTISNQQDMLNTISSVTGTFTTLLSGVAAISLVVGGIGIMNIMLVTVTERTREIGLRKALGAKKKDITTQFLIESIILTFVGGLLGTIIGIATSYIISLILSSAFVITIQSIALATIVSIVIGILFGLYPAKRAANLQPIQALRYE